MNSLKTILLEGRVEDAQQYLEKAVGSWPVAEPNNPAGIGEYTNIEGVLDHFVKNDPSGNNKYLMWMVKKYIDPNEAMIAPNDISSLVERFHKNVDRLSPEIISDMGFYSEAPISKSPKNIDSYTTLATLERVMDEIESKITRKEREKEAKRGVDKLYEDDRWLLVKPNTYEGSCYYGSSTKWCTSSKDAPKHFNEYSQKGTLFYIIDKTHELGDYWKLAVFREWNGADEWYDRADDRIDQAAINAIRSMLPQELINILDKSHQKYEKPEIELETVDSFRTNLSDFINSGRGGKKFTTLNTESGIWDLDIDAMSGTWTWTNRPNPDLWVQATPFWDGRNELPFDSDLAVESDDIGGYGPWSATLGPESLETEWFKQEDYLDPNPSIRSYEGNMRGFIEHIYFPAVTHQLNQPIFKKEAGGEFKTWTPQSYVSTFTFKYPPREGTMTQKFIDYIKQNPKRTSNQFYEDVLGYSRPRAHNNMFFAAIKDAGIVKMERQGRQFVYSLGPNYQDWVGGRLLRNR